MMSYGVGTELASLTGMTIEEVAIGVDVILDLYSQGDNESAHWQEDELLATILRIAAEGEDVKLLAQEAVRLLDTKRRRWFA